MKSSLYLTNSLKTDPLTISPILHLSNGVQYSLSPVTLQPQETAIVDINQALSKNGIAPYATLYGYAEIQYQWPWAIVCATVRNTDVGHSLLFNFAMQPSADGFPTFGAPAQANGPQRLEGMWWKQEPGVSGFLGFSNVSGRPISASLRLTDNQEADLETYHFVVPPHGTKMVNFSQILSASAATGGIYVSYDGPAHALAINGGLQDLATGYSAQLRLQPSPQVSKGQQPELSETMFSELGLMSGPADPMMMFPAGTTFAPYSVVRNISDQPASVTPTLWWMADGAPHSAELPAIAIAPHHTVNLAVPSLIAAAGLQNLTGSLNVVLDTKAQPGALALASGSVDQTNTYVFEVIPHGVGEGASKSLSYWSTGNGDDTMVTLWNPADESQDFAFTLFYVGGQYAFPIHLEARATRTFNISELIRNQTPDAQGNTIPLAVHEGSAEIAGSQGENQMILVAMDSGIYNVRKATCSPTCITCNGVASTSVVVNPFATPVGGTYPLTFYGQWNTGDQYNFTNQSAWGSSDNSIATVGSGNGVVTGVSPGNVSMSVQDNYSEALFVSYYCYFVSPNCPVQRPGGSGGGNITTPSQHTYPNAPLTSCRVSVPYDGVVNQTTGKKHQAQDTVGSNIQVGTPVYAPESGNITAFVTGKPHDTRPVSQCAGQNSPADYIEITGSDGGVTRLYHVTILPNLAQMTIPIHVNGGQQIGTIDISGCTSAPHTHIQRRVNGALVNFTMPCDNSHFDDPSAYYDDSDGTWP